MDSSFTPDPNSTPEFAPDSNPEGLRAAVRERYAKAARIAVATVEAQSTDAGCCARPAQVDDPMTRGNYTDDEAEGMHGALAASLGCGNPTALTDLKPGEYVLDLGSGGGLDVLLSARRVGPSGKAFGLDMTPEMLELARRHQAEAGVLNAEFIQGTIEDIPLGDESVDIVISNCVINLSADKDAVLAEAFRVTKPGGRFAVSDVVLLREDIPPQLGTVVGLWTGCVAGALTVRDYETRLQRAGYTDVGIEITRRYDCAEVQEMAAAVPSEQLPPEFDVGAAVDFMDGAIASAFIRARRPH